MDKNVREEAVRMAYGPLEKWRLEVGERVKPIYDYHVIPINGCRSFLLVLLTKCSAFRTLIRILCFL